MATERLCVEKDSSLLGTCSIIDYKALALSRIVDSVAALSCEALKANVTSFSSLDLKDNKSASEVASDLKVLLNGFVGDDTNEEVEAVSKIPGVHGRFRDVVKELQADVRAGLNSSTVGSGNVEAMGTRLVALLDGLRNVGECCYIRAKQCFQSIENEDLLRKLCLEYESMLNGVKVAYDALVNKDYCKFAHFVNESVGVVYRIVGLEVVAAFFTLEAGEKSVDEESKRNKKKKKKENNVLGQGISILVEFIKDRVRGEEDTTSGDLVEPLNVEKIMSILNPEDPGFECFLDKVKEIVESNEKRRLPKIPKGTRDFANEEMIERKKVFATVENVLERHGLCLDTPDFEMRETLRGKYGEDSKLIYDLADQGGELCCLRYDLTVPFARYVAMNKLKSFRRYQIAKVHRRDNLSKGRFREFYQCDLDIAGVYTRMGADFEAVKVMTELLDALKIGDYEIKLSHRKLLDGILKICGVPQEKYRTIGSSIDKLDKQSFDQVKKEMVEEKGLSPETADKIGMYVTRRGPPMELLSQLEKEEIGADKSAKEALEDLRILFEALEGVNSLKRIVFDLSLARGLEYYTGVIFEAVCKGAEVGSIGGGGRYDDLIGKFTKDNVSVPSVGVSLGIERVFTILQARKKQQNQEIIRGTGTQVLVSVIADNKLTEAAKLVNPLWEANIKAGLLVNERWTKHFETAKKCGIPWMVIADVKGLEKGVVTLKKIVEGKYKEVPIDGLDKRLLKLLTTPRANGFGWNQAKYVLVAFLFLLVTTIALFAIRSKV